MSNSNVSVVEGEYKDIENNIVDFLTNYDKIKQLNWSIKREAYDKYQDKRFVIYTEFKKDLPGYGFPYGFSNFKGKLVYSEIFEVSSLDYPQVAKFRFFGNGYYHNPYSFYPDFYCLEIYFYSLNDVVLFNDKLKFNIDFYQLKNNLVKELNNMKRNQIEIGKDVNILNKIIRKEV